MGPSSLPSRFFGGWFALAHNDLYPSCIRIRFRMHSSSSLGGSMILLPPLHRSLVTCFDITVRPSRLRSIWTTSTAWSAPPSSPLAGSNRLACLHVLSSLERRRAERPAACSLAMPVLVAPMPRNRGYGLRLVDHVIVNAIGSYGSVASAPRVIRGADLRRQRCINLGLALSIVSRDNRVTRCGRRCGAWWSSKSSSSC